MVTIRCANPRFWETVKASSDSDAFALVVCRVNLPAGQYQIEIQDSGSNEPRYRVAEVHRDGSTSVKT